MLTTTKLTSLLFWRPALLWHHSCFTLFNFSSLLPKYFAGQATGCAAQMPGADLHADCKDPCVTDSPRSVLKCQDTHKSVLYPSQTIEERNGNTTTQRELTQSLWLKASLSLRIEKKINRFPTYKHAHKGHKSNVLVMELLYRQGLRISHRYLNNNSLVYYFTITLCMSNVCTKYQLCVSTKHQTGFECSCLTMSQLMSQNFATVDWLVYVVQIQRSSCGRTV